MRSTRATIVVCTLAATTGLAACGGAPSKPAAAATPPAKVENRVTEQQLTRVTLSESAEKRLGIEVATAAAPASARLTTLAGEIMLPPGQALIVTAPVAGTVQTANARITPGSTVRKGDVLFTLTPLVGPQRDLTVTMQADVDSANARLQAATQQRERARTLLKEQAGSQRALELAEQELTQAMALADAAATRLARLKTDPLDADVSMRITAPAAGIVRQIQAAPGQVVASGAVLVEIADLRQLWVRVPVHAGDRRTVQQTSSVEIRDLDGGGPARKATPVAAPPSADPLALTTDLYFALANADEALRPGQRVSVRIPAADGTTGAAREASPLVTVPTSAIVYDAQGGAWLYVVDAPRVYRRQRVDIADTVGPLVSIARGLAIGTKVVTAGTAELFGTEFGAGK